MCTRIAFRPYWGCPQVTPTADAWPRELPSLNTPRTLSRLLIGSPLLSTRRRAATGAAFGTLRATPCIRRVGRTETSMNRLETSWQGGNEQGWQRFLQCGPTYLLAVLRLSVGPDGHFLSVLLGIHYALATQRVTFGIQGLFGTGKTYCGSAVLIMLTRLLGLKALFVAEPNLPLQEFSRNIQSRRRSASSSPGCWGVTMTRSPISTLRSRRGPSSCGKLIPAVSPSR